MGLTQQAALSAGKDLHHLSIPTHVNEPLTDLQRRVEAMEYCELLDQVRFSGVFLGWTR